MNQIMKVYIYYDPNLLMCVKKTERIYVKSLYKEVAEYIFCVCNFLHFLIGACISFTFRKKCFCHLIYCYALFCYDIKTIVKNSLV